MIVGGFQKFSLIDYPGKISAVIFTRGCGFRCKYCHNPELIIPDRFGEKIPLSFVFDFLESRRGKLDAVTVSGGEPTEHKDLHSTIKEIKDMGFLVKLDTNGSNPDVLEELIKKRLIDYIAMDIKAPYKKYKEITGVAVDYDKIKKSIKIIMDSNVDYQFRTTVVKELISGKDLQDMAKDIAGANVYYLQKYKRSESLESTSKFTSYSEKEIEEMASHLEKYVKKCRIR